MKIIHLTYPLQLPISDLPDEKHVMAIGDFDGLHLGHRNVINHAKYIGSKQNISTSIMTFDPHPREVLGQSIYSRYLTPLQEKMELFKELGLDFCFVVSFDHTFAKVSPENFVQHMLFLLNVHTVVAGFDFTFGHRGLGTVETLKHLGEPRMDVEVVKPFNLDGYKVSSTFIREQLHLGHLEQVKKYLGRNYCISGKVVAGDARGRTIGFPTANLKVKAPYVIPRHGVFAVGLNIAGIEYKGVMNIGIKPTFSSDELNPTLEVHILEFNQDIYGQDMNIEFISFLRDEEKFASVELLVEQIHRDIKKAEDVFKDKLIY
jgi:riboflavin kinase/FMN adenylyltransferase